MIKRIITAFILIPVVLAALFFLPPNLFLALTTLLTLAAAWEWTGLMELKSVKGRAAYLVFTIIMLIDALMFPVSYMLMFAFAWWVVAIVLILIYPRGTQGWGKGVIYRGLMGVFVLVPCWTAVNYIIIQEDGRMALLFLFVLIWGADSAAYFTGKCCGKTRLAPVISPGKTVEGLIGALIFTIAFSLLVLWLCRITPALWGWGVLLALITVIFSIVGDLFESMMKRIAGVKDSGNILPGHGGILDRIDSLTAAAPIFVFASWILGTVFG